MSKKLILALTAAMAFGVFACGGDDDEGDNEGGSTTVECTANADCADRTDGKTECDTANGVCVAPAQGDDPGTTPECTTNDDCADNADGKTECDTANGVCVAPAQGDDPGTTPECTTNDDCADNAEGKTECDTENGVCVAPEIPFEKGMMKISQVYFGGFPNIGTKYNKSYIEVFNAGSTPVDLRNYNIIYAKDEITDSVPLSTHCNENCIVPAGGYFLMTNQSLEGSDEMPGEDLTGDIDLGGTPNMGENGIIGISKIADLGESNSCNELKDAVDDLISMGGNSWCHEGTNKIEGISSALGNRNIDAYFRNDQGCMDTDDNAADFEVREALPRNSQTAVHICGAE